MNIITSNNDDITLINDILVPMPNTHNDSPLKRYLTKKDSITWENVDIEQPLPSSYYDLYERIYKMKSFYNINHNKNHLLTIWFITSIWISYIIDVVQSDRAICSHNAYFNFKTVGPYPLCNDLRYQIWRLFSSSFIHERFSHIFPNTIILFPSMYILESLYTYKSLIILISICLHSGVIHTYFDPYTSCIGCSHIVFGTNGALFADIILNYRHISYQDILAVLIYIVFVIFMDIISYTLMYSDNIAYTTHWSGWIAGFLTSLILSVDRETKRRNNYVILLSAFVLFIYSAFFIYNYIVLWPIGNDNYIIKDLKYEYCCEFIIKNKDIPQICYG